MYTYSRESQHFSNLVPEIAKVENFELTNLILYPVFLLNYFSNAKGILKSTFRLQLGIQ